jgi:hypothetical protein
MIKKTNKGARVRDMLAKYPNDTNAAIASKVGCDQSYVYLVHKKLRAEKVTPVVGTKEAFTTYKGAEKLDIATPQHDEVNHPSHYTDGGIETIDYIEAKLSPEEFRGYCVGNALKYMSRAGKKGDATTDLRKAQWYLARAVKQG